MANTRQGAKALRHTWEERLTVSGELMPALTPYFLNLLTVRIVRHHNGKPGAICSRSFFMPMHHEMHHGRRNRMVDSIFVGSSPISRTQQKPRKQAGKWLKSVVFSCFISNLSYLRKYVHYPKMVHHAPRMHHAQDISSSKCELMIFVCLIFSAPITFR